MSTGFKRAERTAVKLKALVIGPSGSGKTLGALHIAHGIAPGKVAVVDSEQERASYYADAVPFDSLALSRHRPADYMRAIDMAVEAGYEVVVLDSLTHAWMDVLARKEAYDKANPRSNQWTNWRTFGEEWEALLKHLLAAPIHVIATARSKQAYEQVEQAGGKKQIMKMGLQPILRENTEYEFALVFDLQPSHKAAATKDNTQRFDIDDTTMWDLCDGSVVKELKAWMAGAAPAKVVETTVTDEQRGLIAKLSKSHVFSDGERNRMAAVADREKASAAIDWATAEIAKRKAAEKAEGSASGVSEMVQDNVLASVVDREKVSA